jgi:DNA repair protein RecO (recombination protein O)
MATQARETDALVLNCTEHGESDMIVTLFCHDVGRLTAIAKGAKKVNGVLSISWNFLVFCTLPINRRPTDL